METLLVKASRMCLAPWHFWVCSLEEMSSCSLFTASLLTRLVPDISESLRLENNKLFGPLPTSIMAARELSTYFIWCAPINTLSRLVLYSHAWASHNSCVGLERKWLDWLHTVRDWLVDQIAYVASRSTVHCCFDTLTMQLSSLSVYRGNLLVFKSIDAQPPEWAGSFGGLQYVESKCLAY
jgi:hypothetical protein